MAEDTDHALHGKNTRAGSELFAQIFFRGHRLGLLCTASSSFLTSSNELQVEQALRWNFFFDLQRNLDVILQKILYAFGCRQARHTRRQSPQIVFCRLYEHGFGGVTELKFLDSKIHCLFRSFPHEHQTADGSLEPPFYLPRIFPDFSLSGDEALKRHGKEVAQKAQ